MPVLFVHHRVADAHFGEIAQHRVDVAAAGLALADTASRRRVELGLGDQRDVRRGPGKAAVRRADRESGAGVAGDEFFPSAEDGGFRRVFGEVLLHGCILCSGRDTRFGAPIYAAFEVHP